MRTIGLMAICCCSFLRSFSQIETLRIGVNGLTCSQCTRSVEKKLRQLPFIQDVTMDLANTSGEIHLKSGASFRPEAIARAIRDAGFSVRFVHLLLRNPAGYLPVENCLTVNGLNFRLLGEAPANSPGNWILQLQGSGFGGKKIAPTKSACGNAALPVIVSREE